MEKKEALLSQILDCSPSVIYAKDAAGIYRYVNRQFENLSGYASHRVIGSSDLELFPEETARVSMDNDRRVMASGQPLEREEYGPVEGDLHTFFSVKYPLKDENGQVIGTCGISRDITEKRKLEQQLEKTRELVTEIGEIAKVAFWKFDLDSQVLSWGGSVPEVYPSVLEPLLLSGGPAARLHPEDSRVLTGALEQARRSGISFETRVRLPAPDKSYFWVQLTCQVEYREGRPGILKGVIHDVDQLEKISSELEESEGRYQTLFRDSLAKMLIIDPENGAIVDANKSALSYYGYGLDQITAKRITDINLLPENSVRESMNLALHGARNKFRFKHRLSDGSERDVEVFSGPIMLSGRNYLYSMVHDVTEELETEAKLFKSNQLREEVFANINEAILIVDPKTQTIIDCNDFCHELLGYEYQECIGKDYAFAFYDPELSETRIDEAFRRKSRKQGVYSRETLVRSKDGVLVATEYDIIRVSDQSDELYVYIVIIRDISKQKEAKFRLEREVSKRTQELQDLNTALTVLLKKHEEDKQKLEESRYRHYTKGVRPLLKRLKSSRNGREREVILKALENSLQDIFSPVSAAFAGPRSLSPQETRIASMIKAGMTSKEIATALNVSVRTVTTHRENIRQKLHIVNSSINLRTYLSSR